ncbi:MAG: IS607 family transposase [Candidatus Odinarchaeota archaeon]
MNRTSDKRLEKHYRIGQAAEILGLTPENLRLHLRAGKVAAIRTPGGHWRIPETELLRLTGHSTESIHRDNARSKSCVIYARVSSQKQAEAGHLNRQVTRLLEFAANQQLEVLETITDIGSGLNESRKGLLKIFKLAREHAMDHVVVEFRDRLTRFGFQFIAECLSLNSVHVLIKEDTLAIDSNDPDLNKELVEDLISIIYSFSGKLYGRRSAKFRKLKKCVEQVSMEDT